MPLPRSRGHMLVDLVKTKNNVHENSIPSNEELDCPVHSRPEITQPNFTIRLETPLTQTSLPNITSEQDLQNSLELHNSTLSELFSPVVEFIDEAETSIPEHNDIIIEFLSLDVNNYENETREKERVQSTCEDYNHFIPDTNDHHGYETAERERGEFDLEHPTPETNDNHGNETSEREGGQLNLEDPDYIPETDNARENGRDEEQRGRPKRGRKRKYPNQNRIIRKKKANNNEDYISATGKKVSSKEFNGNNFNCNCPRKCTEKLSLEQRQHEFTRYWSAGSYAARCAMIQGSVKEGKTQRSYVIDSKRAFTRKYYLADIAICKKTFLNTLGISQSRIDVALKKFKAQAPLKDNRGVNSGGRNAISEEQLNQIKQFIKDLPKYTSHYCRDNTTANYLAPNLNLEIVYSLYKEKFANFVSISRFKKCFYQDFNLRFKKPQKDTCFRCDRFKALKTSATNSEQTELINNEHQEHLDHAYKLRDQMKRDLARAKIDTTLETLTFDLEKTHCLPRLPTSIVYYKRQLNLHNLGIHCGSTAKGYFYIWLEHEAGRGTQEVGSCIKKFISTHLKPTATELILWADSCGGQNRSIKMVLLLLHILHTNEALVKITLRFLQPGHTYLPNDSEFGDVECSLKTHIRLYTANDYINVMENCRRKNKFTITRLKKEDFHSVAPIQDRITNRKIDVDKNKISWMTTFAIELRKSDPLKLFMKSKLEDDFSVIDISKGSRGRKISPNFEMNLPILYPDGRELSSAKVKDLKEMMKLIPADAKPFYNFLRNVRSTDFMDDTDGFGSVIDFDIEELQQED